MGTIWEFFGYRSTDRSTIAREAVRDELCPFLGSKCEKTLNDGLIAGACAIKPATSGPVITCPIRLYADDYRILRDITDKAFGTGLKLEPGRTAAASAKAESRPAVAVFGKKWGGELRLPQKNGEFGYFVDWVLALLDANGSLVEFVAVEVQAIDTTGNYRNGRLALMGDSPEVVKTTAGLNWENVNKRILPQLIYKGQILQREELCKKGLFFVCPSPVFGKITSRLGGKEKLDFYPLQPSTLTFMVYDHIDSDSVPDGVTVPLQLETDHSTAVYKLQEAFNNVTLPERNVFQSAIVHALEG